MEFGICVMPKPDSCAHEARLAEELGFSHIWVADTQLMAGDVFVCLALIAAATQACQAWNRRRNRRHSHRSSHRLRTRLPESGCARSHRMRNRHRQ
jgi:hypothetical protein